MSDNEDDFKDDVEAQSPAPAASAAKKKKKKKKKKAKATSEDNTAADTPPAAPTAQEVSAVTAAPAPAAAAAAGAAGADADKLRQMMDLLGLARRGRGAAAESKEYKFWKSQPVPSLDADASELAQEGPLETKTVDEVRPTPYNMPTGYEWSDVDITDTEQLRELYTLLTENYVEDDDAMFRFDYSPEFLQWALLPPGYLPQLHIGVRKTSTRQLVAFISGIPAEMRVNANTVSMVEINFLCAHKTLREKRLAPVLIKEVTRRVNLTNVWQAVYTAGVVLPKPVSSCQYFHRSLNPRKLVEVGFSGCHGRMTISRLIKLNRLPQQTAHPFRPLCEADVPSGHALMTTQLSQFGLAPALSVEDFAHWFLPRDGVVSTFVLVNTQGTVTDLVSYYSLPSSVMKSTKYDTLNAAYSYYNAVTTISLQDAMRDALILAKQADFDVYNALNVMQNQEFLEPLKFGPGDGQLQYYLYNWRCPEMPPSQIGLVLM